MNTFTKEQAGEFKCPLARTFIRGTVSLSDAGCIGPTCACWRWMPLPADLLMPHVKKAMEGNALKHKEAVSWVMDHREELGIPTAPTHGYCGVGGDP